MSTYSTLVKRVARRTGYSYREIVRLYKGRGDALRRTSERRFPRISLSRVRYEAELARLRRVNPSADRGIVRDLYNIEKTATSRIKTITAKAGQTVEGIPFREWKNNARKIQRGRNAGKYRFWVDTLRREVITGKSATRIRGENFQERLVVAMLTVNWGDYRTLHKYATKAELRKIRRRKKVKGKIQPTIAELRAIARRVYDAWPASFEDVQRPFPREVYLT